MPDLPRPADRNAHIVVLSVNDVHDAQPDENQRGGVPGLATLLERERAKLPEDARLLVTLNGDFLSGSQLGERCKGAHMIELMNHLGIEYVVLGNHEFDFGCGVLRERMKASKFKYFGSNVLENPSNKLLDGVVDTEIVTLKDGLKLGLFGVCTEDTPQTSYPGDDVVFADVFKTSKRCVETLQVQGADFIIAITHLLIEEDKLLARRVKGIDVILGGHDHEPFTMYEGSTFIHKSGQNAMWLAKIELHLSKSAAHPQRPMEVSTQWTMLSNHRIPPDTSSQKIIRQYTKMLEAEDQAAGGDRVLAVLARPLSTKTATLRSRACSMGNLVADALRNELDADFGLINGGFIRGNHEYSSGSSLTAGILRREMPFPRPGVLVRIQARFLRDAVAQHLAKYPQTSGSHPHVSGLRITVDTTLQPPVVTEMRDESGQEVDLETQVLVATTKFIAEGGDGCSAWMKGQVVRIDRKVAEIVAAFVERKRVLAYPEDEARIDYIE